MPIACVKIKRIISKGKEGCCVNRDKSDQELKALIHKLKREQKLIGNLADSLMDKYPELKPSAQKPKAKPKINKPAIIVTDAYGVSHKFNSNRSAASFAGLTEGAIRYGLKVHDVYRPRGTNLEIKYDKPPVNQLP